MSIALVLWGIIAVGAMVLTLLVLCGAAYDAKRGSGEPK